MSIVKIADVCEHSKTGMVIQVGNLESFKKIHINYRLGDTDKSSGLKS